MMMASENLTPQKWAFRLTHILNTVQSVEARFPVDVKTLAKDFSHDLYPDDPITLVKGGDLPKFEGGLFAAPPGKKGWGIIYNNSMDSPGRINFTLAHEFGHYLLHRNDYPEGIQCGEQDMVKWDSEYGIIEQQANVFAANLLMPLDDFRAQIAAKAKVSFDEISHCADRYSVSLIAATLRWIQYTERQALLVVAREGLILWARSSPSAYKAGIFYKTSGRPPIPVPTGSLASGSFSGVDRRAPFAIGEGVWHTDPCEEMVIFSDSYDFTISVVQF